MTKFSVKKLVRSLEAMPLETTRLRKPSTSVDLFLKEEGPGKRRD